MNLMPLAWSFPVWKCKGCRMEVEWEDAQILEDGGVMVGVLCEECDQ